MKAPACSDAWSGTDLIEKPSALAKKYKCFVAYQVFFPENIRWIEKKRGDDGN